MRDEERVNFCKIGDQVCEYKVNMHLNACVECRSLLIIDELRKLRRIVVAHTQVEK